MRKRLLASAFALTILTAAGCATQQESAVPTNTLLAAKVATAPSLAAGAGDAAWLAAKPLRIDLTGGENFGGKGSTTATLRAVYTSDTLYMLIQYADPTNSIRRGPFQK